MKSNRVFPTVSTILVIIFVSILTSSLSANPARDVLQKAVKRTESAARDYLAVDPLVKKKHAYLKKHVSERPHFEGSREHAVLKSELDDILTVREQHKKRFETARAETAEASHAYAKAEPERAKLLIKALGTIKSIQAYPGANPNNSSRAIQAIKRDIPEFAPLLFTAWTLTEHENVQQIKRPLENVKRALETKAGGDPFKAKLAQKLFDQAASPIKGAVSATDTAAGLGLRHLGTGTKLMKLVEFLDQHPKQLMTRTEFKDLADALNFTESVLPANGAVMGGYIGVQATLVEAMDREWDKVLSSHAYQNLDKLYLHGTSQSPEFGTDWHLESTTLFGNVEAMPILVLDKEVYWPGSAMKVYFISSERWVRRLDDQGAWLGLISASLKSTSSDENDKHDLQYHYLRQETGTYSGFLAPEKIGRYEIRMFDSDPSFGMGDGKLVYSVPFEVKEIPEIGPLPTVKGAPEGVGPIDFDIK